MPETTEPTPTRVTFESARSELEDVVRRLEAGGISLEDSLALWERGEGLARTCQEFLHGARARLDARQPDPRQPDPRQPDARRPDTRQPEDQQQD
jgi:exodeoxyribonuclease VII small subunit